MGASGLGALLVKEGFLTEQDRVTITKTCGQGSWAFAKCILSTGLLDEDELSAFFAERTKYVVAPKNLLDRLDTAILEQIDRRMVSRLEVLPLEIDHHKITVAVADPLDKSTIKQLEFFTGLEVVSVIAPLSQIYEGLSRLNPEFKPRPTALSNFLRNHAGAAWVKQKIVEEGDVDVPQEKRAARGGLVEDYDEDQVEDVSLDDEIDALEDSSDSLSDIDAGGLDEGIGNSDFDDIELEDNGSDLELTPGEDPDEGEAIDDAGLDLDDPFDSFDDAPKSNKVVAAPSDDDLEGLESGGGGGDDLWPDADDAPAAAPVKKAAAADDLLDESADLGELGLEEDAEPKAAKKSDDDESKAATSKKKAADDDFGFGDDSDEPVARKAADAFDVPMPAKAAAKSKKKSDDDDFGLGGLDDLALDDEPKDKAAADDDFGLSDDSDESEKKAADDDFGSSELDDLALDDEPKGKTAADDDFGLSDDSDESEKKAADDDFGSSELDDLALDDEPKGKTAADDDFGLSDDSDESEKKAADDDFGSSELDDLALDDEPKGKAAAKPTDLALGDKPKGKAVAKAAELAIDDKPKGKAAAKPNDLAIDDKPKGKAAAKPTDLALGDKPKGKSAEKAVDDDDKPKGKPSAKKSNENNFSGLDDLALDDNLDLADEDIDALLDEPAPPAKAGGDLLAFPSTRIAEKPARLAHDNDRESVEFAEDEETSVSLRKAVHEDGILPEFDDPSADDVKEETRIDLHAASDEDAETSFHPEDTNIKLHAAKAEESPLEDLAMGFSDDDAIDEPKVAAAKPGPSSIASEPTIDAFEAAEWGDIPIDEPIAPARAGGRSTAPAIDNGSVASLTATAKANEALLRMSLCFDRKSALAIAREYLPQISATGCLIDIGKTTEALATWRAGAQSTTKGKGASTIQTMAKAAKPGQWSQVAVNASNELFGPIKSISVYTMKKADGRTLLLAGDYPIEDETLREALTSFAEQLGAK